MPDPQIVWIVNLINAQNPPPGPKGRPPGGPRPVPRDRKVQNEIEQFLREAMGQRPAAGQPPQAAPAERPAPRRRPVTPKRVPQTTPPAAKVPVAQRAEAPRQRPGEGISQRETLASRGLGGNVLSHVQEHMAERMDDQVGRHLPHSVNQNVTDHLGSFSAQDRDTRVGVRPSHPLASGLLRELRRPESMRRAIVVREILAPPKALRR